MARKPVSKQVIIVRVRRAARQIAREMEFLYSRAALPLGASEEVALMELERRRELRVLELSSLLRLDKSTTSRLVASLVSRKLVLMRTDSADERCRKLAISAKGRRLLEQVHKEVHLAVGDALGTLGSKGAHTAEMLEQFAGALSERRTMGDLVIRPIRREDDRAVAKLIRAVMPEIGAGGEGFAIHDPEVDKMYATYRKARSRYYVIERKGRIVGGGGVAPLKGAAADVCELQKMYFLGEVRGQGLGRMMLEMLLADAQDFRFRSMYIETLRSLAPANTLYARFGFKRVKKPLGNTGHTSCDIYYVKTL